MDKEQLSQFFYGQTQTLKPGTMKMQRKTAVIVLVDLNKKLKKIF